MWIRIYPRQNPNDPNFAGALERGNAIFDQRNRFVLSGFYVLPLKITFWWRRRHWHPGLPYNITTGPLIAETPGRLQIVL